LFTLLSCYLPNGNAAFSLRFRPNRSARTVITTFPGPGSVGFFPVISNNNNSNAVLTFATTVARYRAGAVREVANECATMRGARVQHKPARHVIQRYRVTFETLSTRWLRTDCVGQRPRRVSTRCRRRRRFLLQFAVAVRAAVTNRRRPNAYVLLLPYGGGAGEEERLVLTTRAGVHVCVCVCV
jgi:hypothetical protein